MHVEQWTPLVYRLVRKYFKQNEEEIEDIVQDCLLHLVKVAPKFDAARSKEITFVWMTVSRYIIGEQRKRARQAKRPQVIHAPIEVVEIGRPMDDDLLEVMQVVREATENTAFRIRRMVRTRLYKSGWPMSRIDETFAKISENLYSQGERRAYIVSQED